MRRRRGKRSSSEGLLARIGARLPCRLLRGFLTRHNHVRAAAPANARTWHARAGRVLPGMRARLNGAAPRGPACRNALACILIVCRGRALLLWSWLKLGWRVLLLLACALSQSISASGSISPSGAQSYAIAPALHAEVISQAAS